MNTQKNKHLGFTLIELMITIALLSILLSLGVPYFRETITNNKIVAETNNLMGSFNLARANAAKLNQPTTICKSSDGVACTTSGSWEQGWILFNDLDIDGVVDAGEEVVQVNSLLPTGFTLRSTSQFTNWISFRPQGDAIGSGGALDDSSSFRVCSPDASGEEDDAKARQIFINVTGRSRSQKGLDAGIDCP